eukprot:CAMPEP_0172681752 /NCGR_PEP_ID=MMETSP1074-20121228/17684_1 /TAXON_ID=2916 /ORGANISM="Ceratium fusus, Strain PA161109" /LENGTH=317 /DNA_ID=CAMNT_0013500309 /DNA_START=100 /DNA_END=1053 /DNA_ORIENTATION=-
MIEAASQTLRQQIARGGLRERPRSKGQSRGSLSQAAEGSFGSPRYPEPAVRRIRSAENQHRILAESREENATDEDLYEDPDLSHNPDFEDVPSFQDLQEFKRPCSRKKDPSASAAAGLGAFAGPSHLTDAFGQRKSRQPIPVESWGPRPPSRAGPPQKATLIDLTFDEGSTRFLGTSRGSRTENSLSSSVGRSAVKLSGSEQSAGATWAAARPRGHSEGTRRGRDRRAPNPKGRNLAEAVSVEDFESDIEAVLHGNFGRDAPAPQLIVTRSAQPNMNSVELRRSNDARAGKDKSQREAALPGFNTSLDDDFLSLFAS